MDRIVFRAERKIHKATIKEFSNRCTGPWVEWRDISAFLWDHSQLTSYADLCCPSTMAVVYGSILFCSKFCPHLCAASSGEVAQMTAKFREEENWAIDHSHQARTTAIYRTSAVKICQFNIIRFKVRCFAIYAQDRNPSGEKFCPFCGIVAS